MELVDIHTFVNMDMDSESRVIAPTSARGIRNLRLNEFGKSGIPVGMRGTKKIHGVQVDPDIPPIVETTGNITVSVLIAGDTEDTTHFRIILTGRSPERPVVSAFASQFAPAIFADIPLDIYDVTQEIPTEYQELSILTTPVDINVGNRYASVVVNEVGPNGLLMEWDDIVNSPSETLLGFNTYFNLPANGSEFTFLITADNKNLLSGATNIVSFPNPSIHLKNFNDKSGYILDAVGFYNCQILESVSLPAITDLKEQFFRYNYSLGEANIPSVTHVRNSAFGYCYVLPKAILPEATHLYLNAFYNCLILGEIYIPKVHYFEPTDGTFSVFYSITGRSLKLTIDASLMTSNYGSPQADIQYLIDNNTVTIFNPTGTQIYP